MNFFAQHLQHTQVGEPQVSGNLTMFPLFRDDHAADGARAGGLDFLAFDEACKKEWVTVSEVSEAGSVPALLLDNRAEQPVFLLDGEQLVGAKQNRTVNLTLLIAAGAKTEIPVSCVEAGRWSRRSRHFHGSRRMDFNRMRREKMAQMHRNMRGGSRRSDQGAVWKTIDEKRAAMRAHAPTAAMDDIYESAAPRLSDYERGLPAAPRQIGAVFAIDGEVSGFDLFSDAAHFAKYLPKLVGSHALDAMEAFDKNAAGKKGAADNTVDKKGAAESARRQVEAFLARFGAGKEEVLDAVGLGRDVRVESDAVIGAGLVLEDECVHLAGFPKEKA